MRWSVRASGVLVVLAAIAVAGCGSSSSKTAATTPAATTTSTTAAKSYMLKATLKPGIEVPRTKDAVGASGTFTATITLHGTSGTLTWVLSFSHLSGPATAAHVHIGAPGKSGPVVVPLCGPCKSPNKGSFTGAVAGSSQLLNALLHGGAYVNVHTKLNPGGEIRGQVSATPGAASTAPPPSTTTSSSSSSY